MNRRAPESSTIDRAHARAQLHLYLSQARPEMRAKVTVDELERRFRLPRREIEQALAVAHG